MALEVSAEILEELNVWRGSNITPNANTQILPHDMIVRYNNTVTYGIKNLHNLGLKGPSNDRV